MSSTLTFGLVEIRNEQPGKLLGSVEGRFIDGYRCTICDQTQDADEVTAGQLYKCEGCGGVEAYDSEPDPGSCCAGDDDDEEDGGYDFERIDGKDGTAEGVMCGFCSAGPVESYGLFHCNDCDQDIDADEAEDHLYKDLEGAWT